MRAWIVLLILLIPAGTAEVLLGDAIGDQEVTAEDGTSVPIQRWDGLDLVELDIEEFADRFEMILSVGDIAPAGENLVVVDGIHWKINFEYRDTPLQIQISRYGSAPISDAMFYRALLQGYEAGIDRWYGMNELEMVVDTSANQLTVVLPRTHIVAADGTGLIKDATLDNIYVESQLDSEGVQLVNSPAGTIGFPIRGYDRMPDDGSAFWTIVEGVEQKGTALLRSAAPVRVSNGEATTLLFELDAVNQATEQHLFTFTAHGVPNNWVLTFPVERLRIDAGAKEVIPVLLTVPFQHQHGLYVPIEIRMHDQHDAESMGQIELGVRYTEVPQPAGHHNTVYLHQQGFGGYFNTVEVDSQDTSEPIQSRSSCGCGDYRIQRFDIPLLPGLMMGLDVDMEGTGVANIPIQFSLDSADVIVSGEIGVYLADDSRPGFFSDEKPHSVMALERMQLDFTGEQTQVVEMQITPREHGDYLPFAPETSLILHLDVAVPAAVPGFCCISLTDATIQPGGMMQLPLDEYHDDVDQFFSSLSGLELYAQKQHRYVNAGETVVFNVTLENLGSQSKRFHLETTGTNLGWARILGDDLISVAAGATRPLAVSVTVPMGTADGEFADIALHAADADDSNIRSLVRLVAEVDSTTDYADEIVASETLDGALHNKDSPGLPLVMLLAALLLVRRK